MVVIICRRFLSLLTLQIDIKTIKNCIIVKSRLFPINKETNKIALNFFNKANQEKKIQTIDKPALETLKDLKEQKQKFDLVFIDADKENYKNYYDQSLDLIDTNGLIVIDNVLWHGEVSDKNNQDKLTIIIREFNSYVNNDKRTENLIIPLGDGLTICRKL